MNWVSWLYFFKYWAKRNTFASSRAASTSSSTQNGTGLTYEVEAALDEANVFRFAQYLKKYSHETQFIVITHRKGTMEEADVLYGVTMQESGVSKLVSVKLEETKELVQ